MTFTPLETACITGLVSLLVHAVTRIVFVSKAQCKEYRAVICGDVCQARKDQGAMHADIKARTSILFRMVRALVVHDKDMPPEVKADIINETPGGNGE